MKKTFETKKLMFIRSAPSYVLGMLLMKKGHQNARTTIPWFAILLTSQVIYGGRRDKRDIRKKYTIMNFAQAHLAHWPVDCELER